MSKGDDKSALPDDPELSAAFRGVEYERMGAEVEGFAGVLGRYYSTLRSSGFNDHAAQLFCQLGNENFWNQLLPPAGVFDTEIE